MLNYVLAIIEDSIKVVDGLLFAQKKNLTIRVTMLHDNVTMHFVQVLQIV